jgi:hypothetical protein
MSAAACVPRRHSGGGGGIITRCGVRATLERLLATLWPGRERGAATAASDEAFIWRRDSWHFRLWLQRAGQAGQDSKHADGGSGGGDDDDDDTDALDVMVSWHSGGSSRAGGDDDAFGEALARYFGSDDGAGRQAMLARVTGGLEFVHTAGLDAVPHLHAALERLLAVELCASCRRCLITDGHPVCFTCTPCCGQALHAACLARCGSRCPLCRAPRPLPLPGRAAASEAPPPSPRLPLQEP